MNAGANGRTGKEWKKLLPYLRTRLGGHCNVSSLSLYIALIYATVWLLKHQPAFFLMIFIL